MVEGCLEWQESGLGPPETFRAATKSYFDNQDLFSQWLEEQCDTEPGNEFKKETSADLFASWAAYAKAAGDLPGTRKSFARLLERHHFTSCLMGHDNVRGWQGIRLKPTANHNGYGKDY